MRVTEVPCDKSPNILPGADFADAWRISAQPALPAREIADRLSATMPGWAMSLLKLRNILVAPLGLKTDPKNEPAAEVVLFPVLETSPDRVVLGLDDKHLDFRFVIETKPVGELQDVTATTYVRTHNLGGRLYLKAITPFHRAIVPAMLRASARG